MAHAFIRAYHEQLGISDLAAAEYTAHTSTIVDRPSDGRETHLLVAFDRRKHGLLTSWRVVRGLRRFCRAHMPWVSVDTYSHVLLEHRIKQIPAGSRVCVLVVVTPASLDSCDIAMDLADAARFNTNAMCVYDFAKSSNKWKEFQKASASVRPQLATTFDVPFLESYGIGPSCLNVVRRLWRVPVQLAMDGEGEMPAKKSKKKKGSADGVDPIASEFLMLRFARSGGDWGYDVRARLLDHLPHAAIISDFHGEIDSLEEIVELACHTNVLCVLLSPGVATSELLAAALHAARRHPVKVALFQHVRESLDLVAEAGHELV